MNNDFWLGLILRWLHIVPAVVLGGALIFLKLVRAPATDTEGGQSFMERTRATRSRIVAICTVLLLATGLINAVRNIILYDYLQPGYHGLVALKLLLALGVFTIAALLAGRTSLAQRMRERTSYWLSVAALLVLAVILIGGWMKNMERVPKDQTSEITQTQ